MPLSFAHPQAKWTAPELRTLPSWRDAKRVAVDVETCDPMLKKLGPGVRRGGYMVGVSFAIEDGPSHYLPWGHQGGGNLDKDHVFAYLLDQVRAFRGDIVGNNLSYDLDYLWEQKIEFHPGTKFLDIQVAEPLIDELQPRHNMEAICSRRKMPGKDETELNAWAEAFNVDPKADLWRLPAAAVGRYAEVDSERPLQVLRKQEHDIEDQELGPIYRLETAVLPCLVRMRRRGVRFSLERLDAIEQWALERETEDLKQIATATGVTIAVGAVWKPEVLAPALRVIGYNPTLTAGRIKDGLVTGQKPSITKEVLESLKHPVASLIRHAREVNKLRTTFCASIREHAIGDRVHPTIHQLRSQNAEDDNGQGARWGRCSSTNPNIQQQPVRHDEFGERWRSIYIPEDDEEWICSDFSQQEPRVLTHYAEILGLPMAHEAAERFRNDQTTDNHQMMAELTGLPRKLAKNIYLGLCYGMGGAKLARELGLPTAMKEMRDGRMVEVAGEEAQRILDRFNSHAPFVRKLARHAQGVAEERGYVVTLLGRRCRFPTHEENNDKKYRNDGSKYDWCHKALNRIIQGGSADQTKKAIVDADAAGIPINMAVHDELNASGDRNLGWQLKQIMEAAVPLRVPNKSDLEMGPSWGELEKMK
jgi:DNA polymerase I-like protein with 3'-5' exonuclease and polymerase domains